MVSVVVVSSTYFHRSFQSARRLFIMIRKRIGPKTVPWGTPPLRICHSDTQWGILTRWLRRVRKLLIQFVIQMMERPYQIIGRSIINNRLDKTSIVVHEVVMNVMLISRKTYISFHYIISQDALLTFWTTIFERYSWACIATLF
jgi:hypothetical protein